MFYTAQKPKCSLKLFLLPGWKDENWKNQIESTCRSERNDKNYDLKKNNKKNGEKKIEYTFINCEAWDSGAEVITNVFSKGDMILVNGAIKIEKDNKACKIRVKEFTSFNG